MALSARTRRTAAPRVSIAGGWATRTVNLDRSEELLLATRVTHDGLPRGGTVTAVWKQVDGPGTVTFRNPNPARTFASFSSPGVYNLELSVTDSDSTIVRRVRVEAISRDALASVTSPRLSEDIKNTQAIWRVIKGGFVFDPEKLRPERN